MKHIQKIEWILMKNRKRKKIMKLKMEKKDKKIIMWNICKVME